MPYSPEILALTLSRRCNIQCAHCIVDAGPRETEVLGREQISRILDEASLAGFREVRLYGGEPFLFFRDLLPDAIDMAFSKGFLVSIGSNGFWGRTEKLTEQVLGNMDTIAASHGQLLPIVLSIDQYHQAHIPVQSIANIIMQFKKGDYPHLRFGVQTFEEAESDKVIDQVYKACQDNGVYLIESNDGGKFMYPALPSEFIEHAEHNYETIARCFGLPPDADSNLIDYHLVTLYRYKLNKVIARKLDRGKGVKKYLVFPDPKKLIAFAVEERVIRAGRAQKGGKFELALDYANKGPDYLIIGPNGRAFAYPAQMTAEEGVFMDGKPIIQVIMEVGKDLALKHGQVL